jgi:hypothetical protein
MGFLTLLVFGLLVSGYLAFRCLAFGRRTSQPGFDEGGLAIWRCQETPLDVGPRRIGLSPDRLWPYNQRMANRIRPLTPAHRSRIPG